MLWNELVSLLLFSEKVLLICERLNDISILRNLRVENFEGLAMMAEKKRPCELTWSCRYTEWTPVYRAVTDDQDWGYEITTKDDKEPMRWVGGGVTVKTHTLRWATNKLGGWSQLQGSFWVECELHIRLPNPGVLHQEVEFPETPGLGFEHQ